MNTQRRQFLSDVGKGMLVASVGPTLASDLGLASILADSEPRIARLDFGKMEPLVTLMQETPSDKLLPKLIEQTKKRTDLRELISAGAMANSRALGGHDYDGYHTFMALSPALEMSRELPEARRALPVLKVLYRNATVIQRHGGLKHEMLHQVNPAIIAEEKSGAVQLRDATLKMDMDQADRTMVGLINKSLTDAYDDLQSIIQDEADVHRVVLAWRAWAMLDVAGQEHASTFLRQSVHYCVENEQRRKAHNYAASPIRVLLPKLLDQYKLVGKALGTRQADDAWVEKMCQTVYASSREQAADAVAAALADGIAPAIVAEAICLAANRLVLCDVGRVEAIGTKGKLSVHGDSVGVHASDSANAWRHIASISSQRNTVASLIVGAFHTGGQSAKLKDAYPHASHLEMVKTQDQGKLIQELDEAIRSKNQGLSSAIVQRYGELGHEPRQIMDVMLKYAISEDGALHAEKYYRTATEEFRATRPAFRWRQLVALARVTASECGLPAPGYAEACELLKLS
jgi:hypothetical protein